MATTRLYYDDPNLLKFTSHVFGTREIDGRIQVAFEETAFYPTSGGQPFDTGILSFAGSEAPVIDVVDDDAGLVWHVLDTAVKISVGDEVNGEIDAERRLDHRQQHTGQHLLSAVLWERFGYATVSFHMGDESCTIDLDSDRLSDAQAAEARKQANRVIAENRPLLIQYCSVEEARVRGVRKIAAGLEQVRLIEIPGVDLNACGGTHVNATGEIGCILIRKLERARQGMRLEFVCGQRAVRTAARDYEELRAAGGVLSAGVWSVAEQVSKVIEEAKAQTKRAAAAELEVAQLMGTQMADGASGVMSRRFNDRDAGFVKVLAQSVVRAAENPVVLLFAAERPSPTLIFARTEHDSVKAMHMGELLKSVVANFGGRGGGSISLAQGGVPHVDKLDAALAAAARAISKMA